MVLLLVQRGLQAAFLGLLLAVVAEVPLPQRLEVFDSDFAGTSADLCKELLPFEVVGLLHDLAIWGVAGQEVIDHIRRAEDHALVAVCAGLAELCGQSRPKILEDTVQVCGDIQAAQLVHAFVDALLCGEGREVDVGDLVQHPLL